MMKAAVLSKVAQIAKIAERDMSPNTRIHPAEWDSVDLLDLIAAIDEAYGVSIATESLHHCQTLGDMTRLIEQASASA